MMSKLTHSTPVEIDRPLVPPASPESLESREEKLDKVKTWLATLPTDDGAHSAPCQNTYSSSSSSLHRPVSRPSELNLKTCNPWLAQENVPELLLYVTTTQNPSYNTTTTTVTNTTHPIDTPRRGYHRYHPYYPRSGGVLHVQKTSSSTYPGGRHAKHDPCCIFECFIAFLTVILLTFMMMAYMNVTNVSVSPD